MDKPVSTLEEVRRNVLTLYSYRSGSPAEKIFHARRIKNGKSFVVLRVGDEYLFAPSRFAGYPNNDTNHAKRLNRRDGRATDVCLDRLLGRRLYPGDRGYSSCDRAYLKYCREYGFNPSKGQQARRYWLFNSQSDDQKAAKEIAVKRAKEKAESDATVLESLGLTSLLKKFMTQPPPKSQAKVFSSSVIFDRSPIVIAIARVRAGYSCELDGCAHPSFETSTGRSYCEVHHIVPLCDGGPDTPPNVACLCASHHREAHLGKDRASIRKSLQKLRRKNSQNRNPTA